MRRSVSRLNGTGTSATRTTISTRRGRVLTRSPREGDGLDVWHALHWTNGSSLVVLAPGGARGDGAKLGDAWRASPNLTSG